MMYIQAERQQSIYFMFFHPHVEMQMQGQIQIKSNVLEKCEIIEILTLLFENGRNLSYSFNS